MFEAIEAAGFEANLVSDADEVGIIQKRIIQNLYENPVVVCDVSGKNPNVMFELGIRLAFDKPTIIVKDDKTSYSFDTAPIEHLEYPRDLRFAKIVEFKEELAEKIIATHERSTKDKDYTTFLKHFGTFSIPKIDTKEVSKDAFIVEQLQLLQKSMTDLTARVNEVKPSPVRKGRVLCLSVCDPLAAENVATALATVEGIGEIVRPKTTNRHFHFVFPSASGEARDKALQVARQIVPKAHYLGN